MTIKRRPLVKKSSTSGKTAPASKKSIRINTTETAPKKSVARTRKVAGAGSTTAKYQEKSFPPIYTEKDMKKKVAGITFFQLSNRLDLPLESERFAVAVEILKGAETRQDVNHRVRDLLPPSVRTKTPKAVSNLVSSVIKRMVDSGFTVEGEWRMTPPKA
jgi:hypothetical protein